LIAEVFRPVEMSWNLWGRHGGFTGVDHERRAVAAAEMFDPRPSTGESSHHSEPPDCVADGDRPAGLLSPRHDPSGTAVAGPVSTAMAQLVRGERR
jgi:hypothetical protein